MVSFKSLNQVLLLPCFLLAIIKPRFLPVALHLFGSLTIAPVVFFFFLKLQAHWKFQRNARLVLASALFLSPLPRNFLSLSLPGRVWILVSQRCSHVLTAGGASLRESWAGVGSEVGPVLCLAKGKHTKN